MTHANTRASPTYPPHDINSSSGLNGRTATRLPEGLTQGRRRKTLLSCRRPPFSPDSGSGPNLEVGV
jgi:hypothetical protein